jgi:hypothetical protein
MEEVESEQNVRAGKQNLLRLQEHVRAKSQGLPNALGEQAPSIPSSRPLGRRGPNTATLIKSLFADRRTEAQTLREQLYKTELEFREREMQQREREEKSRQESMARQNELLANINTMQEAMMAFFSERKPPAANLSNIPQ